MMGQMIDIRFEVDGKELADFNRELDNRWDRADNLKKPLDDAAQYMLDQIKQNFAKSGSIWKRWPKRKKFYTHPILRKTGKLSEGFDHRVGPTKAVISNPVSYFKFHQLGTSKMPARKMWGINNRNAREIQKRIQLYLQSGG